MQIAGRDIGERMPPYIVAEIGANHGRDLDRALRMIDAAKAAGADAVKFQAYTADTITLDSNRPEFKIAEGPWQGWRLYDLYKKGETPFEWFPRLFEHAKAMGITCFASVFDPCSIDLLERLNTPAYKIASFEIIDLPLIRLAASTRKPVILSTGMASEFEIDDAISAASATDTAVLHAVSGYPTPIEEANLLTFKVMRRLLSVDVGISDHTTGLEVPIAAAALGAAIIEKHFTLNRRRPTLDSTFSLEPIEFARMVCTVRAVHAAMQPSQPASEETQRPLRRSLFAVAPIAAGEAITEKNVRSIRPGSGLPPQALNSLLGKVAKLAIEAGTPMTCELVE